jgi:hypothetical protein
MVQDAWNIYGSEGLLEISNICPIDHRLISQISEAIDSLSVNSQAFAFYNLMLSADDQFLLSEIQITDSDVLVSYSDATNFENEISDFLALVTNQDAVNLAKIVNITTRIIDSIITASGAAMASISMVAYNDGDAGYFPCWHIDKTHAEELDYQKNPITGQNVFIVTLKGTSTLYHELTGDLRQQFNILANETSHSYGYDKSLQYSKGQGLDKLFSIENSYSASYEQGSVHFAGKLHGAVHATPPGKERLLMIVTPGDSETISQLKTKSYH